MLFDVSIPNISDASNSVLIETVYAAEQTLVTANSKFLDLSINLSSAFSQNCPPISYYRIVVREKLWVRRLLATPGARYEVGDRVAVLSTDADEDLEQPFARKVRLMSAGIMFHADMWSEDAP